MVAVISFVRVLPFEMRVLDAEPDWRTRVSMGRRGLGFKLSSARPEIRRTLLLRGGGVASFIGDGHQWRKLGDDQILPSGAVSID
jgi:hypothetical protein